MSSDDEAIEIEFEWSEDDIKFGHRAVRRKIVENTQTGCGPSTVIYALIAIVLFALISRMSNDVEGRNLFLIGALAGGSFFVAIDYRRIWVFRSRLDRLQFEHLQRIGPHRYKLNHQGMEVWSDASYAKFGWDRVESVEGIQTGILLTFSPQSFTYFPDSCLPPNLTRTDLLAKINTWREAADA